MPGDDKKDPVAKPAEYKSLVDPASMKASLLLLDTRIKSFINNPIFKNTSVVEVGEATRAKRDLDTIVNFSNRIGKEAKKLKQVFRQAALTVLIKRANVTSFLPTEKRAGRG